MQKNLTAHRLSIDIGAGPETLHARLRRTPRDRFFSVWFDYKCELNASVEADIALLFRQRQLCDRAVLAVTVCCRAQDTDRVHRRKDQKPTDPARWVSMFAVRLHACVAQYAGGAGYAVQPRWLLKYGSSMCFFLFETRRHDVLPWLFLSVPSPGTLPPLSPYAFLWAILFDADDLDYDPFAVTGSDLSVDAEAEADAPPAKRRKVTNLPLPEIPDDEWCAWLGEWHQKVAEISAQTGHAPNALRPNRASGTIALIFDDKADVWAYDDRPWRRHGDDRKEPSILAAADAIAKSAAAAASECEPEMRRAEPRPRRPAALAAAHAIAKSATASSSPDTEAPSLPSGPAASSSSSSWLVGRHGQRHRRQPRGRRRVCLGPQKSHTHRFRRDGRRQPSLCRRPSQDRQLPKSANPQPCRAERHHPSLPRL